MVATTSFPKSLRYGPAGTLITTGNVDDVLMDEDVVELRAADVPALQNVLLSYNLPVKVDEKTGLCIITFPIGKANLEEINRMCFSKGVVLNHLILKRKRLEARFFELTSN